jgi:transcription antitermination factor NusG
MGDQVMVVPDSDLDLACWYALRTRHQHEKMAAASLSNKGLEIFLPLYQAVRQRSDRKKRLSLPLFPCYIFLRDSLRCWRDVVTTPGILGFVQIGSRPAVIPSLEIEAVRRVVDGSFQAEPCPFLECGDRVRIRSGPLDGIEGILVRKKNYLRLVLSVEMLGKSVSVEVDSSSIDRISAGNVSLIPGRPSAGSVAREGTTGSEQTIRSF